jgi:hypothetical protein
MAIIVFSNPKKQKMSSGDEYIELTEEGTWESFPAFAEKFVQQIGAKIIKRNSAVDMHLWEIEYEGVLLNFVYSDFPNGVSIEPIKPDAQKAIDRLFSIVSCRSTANGL